MTIILKRLINLKSFSNSPYSNCPPRLMHVGIIQKLKQIGYTNCVQYYTYKGMYTYVHGKRKMYVLYHLALMLFWILDVFVINHEYWGYISVYYNIFTNDTSSRHWCVLLHQWNGHQTRISLETNSFVCETNARTFKRNGSQREWTVLIRNGTLWDWKQTVLFENGTFWRKTGTNCLTSISNSFGTFDSYKAQWEWEKLLAEIKVLI